MGRPRKSQSLDRLLREKPRDVKRRNLRRCGKCPAYLPGECSVLGKRVAPMRPACEYGKKLMVYKKRNLINHLKKGIPQ